MGTRTITVATSRNADAYRFHRMVGAEEVSRLFTYDVTLLSDDDGLSLPDMLGSDITLSVEFAENGSRYFHGHISEFTYLGTDGSDARYLARIRPWLWFLTRSRNCRIFQNKSVPEIIEAVFGAYPIASFENRLDGSYVSREYCVQYRESDFDFVSRLMEFEGICYFFEHQDGVHVLVLSDDSTIHPNIPGYEEVPYFSTSDLARRERDHVFEWHSFAAVFPGEITLQSFDYLKPNADLFSRASNPKGHQHASSEIYDYPGDYVHLSRGEALSQVRLDEQHSRHLQVSGAGTAAGLTAGHLFTLAQYPRADQNAEHMVVKVEHDLRREPGRSAGDNEGETYLCRFHAMPACQRFRPARLTPKPIVQGPQTAIVSGKAGEEIWTNEHGCVKVQFHWDRDGQNDEKTTCWIRVSQAWAGSGFGGIHIPRCGQEVVVDFLEGDPDRPLITGRVYNALSTVPYGLPANQTQSGIKSDTSKGGGGSNELRFEDKAGEEHVYLHAQKDEMIVVENDKSEHVGHDETINIDNDRTETVGHDETIGVGNDRMETVGNNETLSVATNRTRSVGANESVNVGANQTVGVGGSRNDSVGVNETRTVALVQQQTVGAARNVTVGAAQAHEIGASDSWAVGLNRTTEIGTTENLDVGSNRTVDVGGDQGTTIGGAESRGVGKGRTTKVADDDATTVGKTITITAGDEVTIVTGSATFNMKKNGNITLKGKDILIDASGKIDVKATNNIVMKGQKILQN